MSVDQPYTPPASPGAAPTRTDPAYIGYLEQRIAALEARVPNTALLSNKFLTRSFAVVGHYLVAGLIIYFAVLAVFLVIGLMFGGLGGLLGGF